MNLRSRALAFASAGILFAGLWLTLEASATTYDGDASIPAGGIQGQTFTELVVKNVHNGAVVKSNTVNGALRIEASTHLRLAHNNVSSTASFASGTSADLQSQNDTFAGRSYVNATQALFAWGHFKGAVEIRDSAVVFNHSAFDATVCASNSTVQGLPSNLPSCTTMGASTTTPTTTSGSSAPTPTTTATSFSSPPQTPSTPSPGATASPTKYTFNLGGATVWQDVRVVYASSATITDSTVHGDLYVGDSVNVVLRNVEVTGALLLERSSTIDASRLRIGGDLGLRAATSFHVAGATVGGTFGCLDCVHGTLADIGAGGDLRFEGLVDVVQTNVVGHTALTPAPSSVPIASPGLVQLQAEPDKVAFTHEKGLAQGGDADVKVDVTAAQGLAQIALAKRGSAAGPAVKVDSRFEKVVEYVDRDGDGGFGLADHVLAEYAVNALPVQRVLQEPLSGEAGWKVRIDYGLPAGGTFSLVFTTRDADPDHTIVDIEFTDPPYHAEGSRYAVQIRLTSAHDWRIDRGSAEDKLTFLGEGYDGVFSWVHTASVDGAARPVTARVLEEHRTDGGDREIVLFLSYERGRHIYHDPSLGIVESLNLGVTVPPLGNVLVYGSTLAGVVAVLWAIGQPRRRAP